MGKIDRIYIAGIPIDLFTINTLHQTIQSVIIQNNKIVFFHANAYLVYLANTTQKWLIDLFNKGQNYVMCDGSGIEFASVLTRQKKPIKIPFNTWIWPFSDFMVKHDFSIYFLGADEKTIEKAVSNIKKYNKNFNIVGFHHGYFDKNKASNENKNMIKKINALRPNVLFVGFGMPVQEKWIKENFDELQVNAILPCGGAFDFFAGNKQVAPKFLRKLYLEWFYRFLLEPKRLFYRSFFVNMMFVFICIKSIFKKK